MLAEPKGDAYAEHKIAREQSTISPRAFPGVKLEVTRLFAPKEG